MIWEARWCENITLRQNNDHDRSGQSFSQLRRLPARRNMLSMISLWLTVISDYCICRRSHLSSYHITILPIQDRDGSLIKGLLNNFIHDNWPSTNELPRGPRHTYRQSFQRLGDWSYSGSELTSPSTLSIITSHRTVSNEPNSLRKPLHWTDSSGFPFLTNSWRARRIAGNLLLKNCTPLRLEDHRVSQDLGIFNTSCRNSFRADSKNRALRGESLWNVWTDCNKPSRSLISGISVQQSTKTKFNRWAWQCT